MKPEPYDPRNSQPLSQKSERQRIRAAAGEHCMDCGRTYGLMGWWMAPDDLWRQVTGRVDGGGLYCPDCFGLRAYLQGIALRWTAERDR